MTNEKIIEKYSDIDIKKYKIVTDKKKLNIETEKVESIEEGEKIAAILFKVLNNTKAGIGLTANQIGINKSVFVVNVKEPLYFINPVITRKSEQLVVYKESCLSVPRKTEITIRSSWVEIMADNLELPIIFGNKDKNYKNIKLEEYFSDLDLLESIAIQHEFDHTLGILITDIGIGNKPIVHKDKKVGRNEKIIVKKDNETLFIKFKNLKKYEDDGWVLS